MRKMDQKGQISIEFILVVAFMLLLVLLFVPYIGEQNELNTISSAARSGSMDAISNITLLNRTMEPMKVNDVKMIGSGQNLTIQIDISGQIPAYNELIVDATLTSMTLQGYTRDNRTTTNLSDDIIVTSRHMYTVTLV